MLSMKTGIYWGTEMSNQDTERQGGCPGSGRLSAVFTMHEKLSGLESMRESNTYSWGMVRTALISGRFQTH